MENMFYMTIALSSFYCFSKCDMFQTTKSSGFNSTCNAIHFDTETSVSCEDWVYNDDLIHSTAVEDFEMVCGNQSRKSLTQTMYMLGMLIGRKNLVNNFQAEIKLFLRQFSVWMAE